MTWLKVCDTHWQTTCGRYRVIEVGGSWSAFLYCDATHDVETIASGFEFPQNAMRAVELSCVS